MWGALSDERTDLSFTIAAGPRQRSHFRVTIFYCLRFETSLFVASYDSQGYGGGFRPRLHTRNVPSDLLPRNGCPSTLEMCLPNRCLAMVICVTVCYFEILEHTEKVTRRHNPERHNRNIHCHVNLKSFYYTISSNWEFQTKILSRSVCDYRRGWIYWPLTGCNTIADFHTLQITPAHAKSIPAGSVLTRRFLVTTSNNGCSLASGLKSSLNFGSLPTEQYLLQLSSL
jgi:hypothetical protein